VPASNGEADRRCAFAHRPGRLTETVIFRNVGLRGGVAPVRRYLPELLEAVLAGAINPGRIFDFETDLEHVVDGYRAMDERRAVKAMVRVGAVH
jgi:threonine dehydrogenase-like Zn-dependent dehydrogenase